MKREPTNSSTLGKLSVILGAGLFAVILDSLFVPMGPAVPVILIGVITIVALILLVITVTRKS